MFEEKINKYMVYNRKEFLDDLVGTRPSAEFKIVNGILYEVKIEYHRLGVTSLEVSFIHKPIGPVMRKCYG